MEILQLLNNKWFFFQFIFPLNPYYENFSLPKGFLFIESSRKYPSYALADTRLYCPMGDERFLCSFTSELVRLLPSSCGPVLLKVASAEHFSQEARLPKIMVYGQVNKSAKLPLTLSSPNSVNLRTAFRHKYFECSSGTLGTQSSGQGCRAGEE